MKQSSSAAVENHIFAQAAATTSDFESNTNYNYSESAYPTSSMGGFIPNNPFNGTVSYAPLNNQQAFGLL